MRVPAVFRRVQTQSLQAGQLLARVYHLARGVLTGDHVIDLEPRIKHRHGSRVRPGAHVNSAVDDGPEGWPTILRSAAQIQPAVHGDTRADGLQPVEGRLV